jgi:lactate permease
MPWSQSYNPTGHWILSTLIAALPIFVLLGSIAFLRIKTHLAALLGLVSALVVVVLVFAMPVGKTLCVAAYGAAYGLFPIGWIIINVIFLYNLTNQKGLFTILHDSITGVTRDSRLQLLLIAFSFGAFFEGAAGFGTPVAVAAALLTGLGFSPLQASGLSLIANTAPVAFGALGTPILALNGVTGIDLHKLSAMVGRQLPFFSVIVPFWVIWAYVGFKGMIEVWPALLVAGGFFAVSQFLMANFHGPWLVDIVASVASIVALIGFLRIWRPKQIRSANGKEFLLDAPRERRHPRNTVIRAWMPWVVLSVVVFIWGMPRVKEALDHLFVFKYPIPHVNQLIQRMPPVVAKPTAESAVFNFNIFSMTGTGIFVAAVLSAVLLGYKPREMIRTYWQTLTRVRFSLMTVAAMLSLGFLTRYSGLDVTLGLAFARTGCLYPFFGTLLGWLGVALTGSDTSSNVLFGSLQKISAEQIGVSPVLMCSANSSGGVMGKMIDMQSIVVASTATEYYGHEGGILRFVFFHSLALASLVGLLVFLQAYVFPFSGLVVK